MKRNVFFHFLPIDVTHWAFKKELYVAFRFLDLRKNKFALYRTSGIVTLRAESHINRPLHVLFSVVLRIFPAFGTAALLPLPTQCHLTTNSSQQTLLHANDSIAYLSGNLNCNIHKNKTIDINPLKNNRNTKWNTLFAVLCALFTINGLYCNKMP